MPPGLGACACALARGARCPAHGRDPSRPCRLSARTCDRFPAVGWVSSPSPLLVVALVLKAVLPGLPFPAALAFGAIVAPPDAVAATAIARRSRLPRRVVTLLEGERRFNDATALVSYRLAAAVPSGTVSVVTFGGKFLPASVGGLAVAWGVSQLRERVEDPVLDSTLSLLSPFLSFVPAERIGSIRAWRRGSLGAGGAPAGPADLDLEESMLLR